jgi:hypothetical protein
LRAFGCQSRGAGGDVFAELLRKQISINDLCGHGLSIGERG